MGAAYAQAATALVAVMATSYYVFLQFKVLLPFISVVRISGTSVIIYLVALFWQYSGVWLLVNYIVLGLLYFLLLFLFGELNREDMIFVQKLLKRNLAKVKDTNNPEIK